MTLIILMSMTTKEKIRNTKRMNMVMLIMTITKKKEKAALG